MITTSAASGKNITTRTLLASYAATGERAIAPSVDLSNLSATAAVLTLQLSITRSGGAEVFLGQYARAKDLAADTRFSTPALDCALLQNGDTLKVYALSSNTGDTNASATVYWADLPTFAAADVAALILATPANKLVTNAGGQVQVSNVPAIDAQAVRDAMKLAASAGDAAAGSIDAAIAAAKASADQAARPSDLAPLAKEDTLTARTIPAAGYATGELLVAQVGSAAASLGDQIDGLHNLSQAQAQESAASALAAHGVALETTAQQIRAKTQTLGGDGSVLWPITIDDGAGALVPDASVTVSTDPNRSNIVASGRTGQDGTLRLLLNPGTIYVWTRKSGMTFQNPTVMEVTA